ncbi:gephyrin-like molybdotransferase receptor GlpR [Streptomyces sp. SAI-129]|uniref:divisome protein SepX/GlpR n=1 Tax=Streptomyces sp. SAI-129 TaxID=3377727 RepID=UPI003C7A6824
MSSSGLIYAVIVGAWAAYLVPMWLRRQDELNEARPTERFSTAIRLLSGRAGMERRYAKDLRSRSADEAEPDADAPDAVTDSVDVRAFAVSRTRRHTRPTPQRQAAERPEPARPQSGAPERGPRPGPSQEPGDPAGTGAAPARARVPQARRAPVSPAAAARARRSKALARRRRTTVMLFLAFTLGAVVAAVGGLAFLWAPGVPAVLLSAYIAHLRAQERRRFAFQMDRRQAEAAAQRLRDRDPRPRRRGPAPSAPGTVGDLDAEEPDEGPDAEPGAGMSALAADRRALVEQTDHAEWVDQQRERRGRPQGDSWDPVPVPLPTYVTAPVAPRATPDVDLAAPDAWSSARSSAVAPDQADAAPRAADPDPDSQAAAPAEERPETPGRSDARRAASARRARERGRTPLFDQYEDGDRPRAANE